MRKQLLFSIALLFMGSQLSAQTVTCSASGTTPKQNQQYAILLAQVNADRVSRGLPTYANFQEHCAGMMLAAYNAWVETINKIDVEKVASAVKVHGDEVATNPQCTAFGLANGCTKVQLSCQLLTGNVSCN